MATTMLHRSPTPFGHDFDLSLDSSLPSLEDLLIFDMTQGQYLGDAGPYEGQMMDVDDFGLMDLNPAVESSNSHPQSATLTGRTVGPSNSLLSNTGGTFASHQGNQSTARVAVDSASGGSRSPGTTSQILTPASTLLEYNASISDSTLLEGDDTDENLSPISESEYVLVSRSQKFPSGNISGPQASQMSGYAQHPSPSQGSGASDGQRYSRDSSVGPSTTSFSGGQWGTMQAPSGAFIGHQHPQLVSRDNLGFYDPSAYQPTTPFTSAQQQYGETYITDMAVDTNMFNAPIPYRPSHDPQMIGQQTIYGGSSAFTSGYEQAHFRTYGQPDLMNQQQAQYGPRFAHQQFRHVPAESIPSHLSIPSTSSLLVHTQGNPPTAPPRMEQVRSSPSPIRHTLNAPRRSNPMVPSHRTSPYPQAAAQTASANPAVLHSNRQYQLAGPARQPAAGASTSNRPLQAAKLKSNVPGNAPRASAAERGRKGGRQRGAHLADDAKAKSHKMRKVVACWRCALQRDPCDPGSPCNRCLMRAQKGQPYFFECDRSKLGDLVHDFLPAQATMTLMHQKQTIEDTVADQVLHWDKDHPITVYLTSGYGPPLRWSLHEFKPRTNDLLGQFQYLQDPVTGQQKRYHKYSPPFGLLKLDSSDDDYLNKYLDTLLTEDYLWDLGWTCFEEESQVDGDNFQARLVNSMCELYRDTKDEDLKFLLSEILRMLIITYIMGHTLTISEEILPSVLDAVKYSAKGPNQPFTSPRLANRQLKFYFAIFRWNIYEKILKWQQQTLHTSGKKESTWLHSFCAMLGFAMVLEEVQRTVLIQADAKAVKNEMSYEQANTEASNACARIDERWKLLVGLFQCKYRDKKWGENGSFGPSTPRFNGPAANKFLSEVRELLESKSDHLRNRRDVQFGMENQCQYTSRLVARFLLPFLDLPRT